MSVSPENVDVIEETKFPKRASDIYQTHHYVDNKKLLGIYSKWREDVFAARESGTEEPDMPVYYAESIVAIARHLS